MGGGEPGLKLVVITIAKDDLTSQWTLPYPLVCYTGDYEYYPNFPRLKTRFRIEYLAKRRNNAVKKAIELYPDMTHFLMLDSYYINDAEAILRLVRDYLMDCRDIILGASTWFVDTSRVKKRLAFWDSWTNPEYADLKLEDAPAGVVETNGVGGMAIVPRWAWEKQRYGVPEPFPDSGCEHGYLSRCPGIKTFIDFNVRTWHQPPEDLANKPYINRIRTTLGIGTKMREHGIPDILWILRYKLKFQSHYEYLKGYVRSDGWEWSTRGVSDPWLAFRGHEKWLKWEILRKGSLFVDVGAHVGTWSIRASQYYSDVIAFEPSNPTRKVLESNIRHNKITNISVHPYALGEKEKTGMMHHIPWLDGGNTLLEVHPLFPTRKPHNVNPVVVKTLDSYRLSPTLLKIDTEGYELAVMAGGIETLSRTHKAIVECHRDEDVLKIRDLLDQSGFKTRLIVDSETHVVGERRL